MKHTNRSEDFKKELNTRINKISGQINGIKKMIAEDRYCKDVLIQVKSAEKSLKSLALLILNNHLENCVVTKILEGDHSVLDEIKDLLRQEL